MHRRAVFWLWVFLTPLAAGQLGLAQISITADGGGPTLDMGESAVVTFTVTNEGTPGSLEVHIEVMDLPAGWGATLDTGQFELAPGESRQVSLTLTPTDQAALGTASFTVEARGTYSLGPIGQTLDEATDTATVSARLRPAPTEATDWVPVWLIPALVVAAVAAAGSGYWATRRGIRLRPSAARLDAPAGTLAVLPVHIRNASGKTQRINLSLRSDDDAWRPDVVPGAIQLAPGEEKEVELQAIIPDEQRSRCRVTLQALSDSGRRSRTRVRFGVA